MTQVRGITVWEPWATLISIDKKKFETRSWATRYRGKLLIHAAARSVKVNEKQVIIDKLKGTDDYLQMIRVFRDTDFPLGAVVAIANLTDCLLMTDCSLDGSEAIRAHTRPGEKRCIWIESPSLMERAVGDWQPGLYAWKLENIRAIEPIPYKGKQGLWVPSAELIEQLGSAA